MLNLKKWLCRHSILVVYTNISNDQRLQPMSKTTILLCGRNIAFCVDRAHIISQRRGGGKPRTKEENSIIRLDVYIYIYIYIYIYKKFANVECVFVRNTRQGKRYDFRVENYQGSKYKSSYFKSTVLYGIIYPLMLSQSQHLTTLRLKFGGYSLPLMRYFHDLSCYYHIGLTKYCHSLFLIIFLLLLLH